MKRFASFFMKQQSGMLNERSIDICASIVCLVMFVIELVLNPAVDAFSVAFEVAYVLLLIVLPFKPVPTSIGLVTYYWISSLIPMAIQGPSAYWGVWYALVVLGMRSAFMVSIWFAAMTLMTVYIDGALQWGWTAPSAFTQCMTFASFYLIGCMARKGSELSARNEALRYQELQSQERMRLVHILHESVAETLSVAVLQCRNAERDNTSNAALYQQWLEQEKLIENCLQLIRRDIIKPTQASLDEENQLSTSIGGYGDHCILPVGFAGRTLDRAMEEIGDMLFALKFIGQPKITGNAISVSEGTRTVLPGIIHELATNIAKYGQPGAYFLNVDIAESGSIHIGTSNTCNNGVQRSSSMSSEFGLKELKQLVDQRDGQLEYGIEDGEWVLTVDLPR